MNSAVESMQPLEWRHESQTYKLAPRGTDVELLFVARHMAWAANELDRIKGLIASTGYDARLDKQEAMRAGAKFAFGGQLSFEFLCSDDGLIEYVDLLMGEAGGPRVSRKALVELARANHADWVRLWKSLMRRDFPNRFAPGSLDEAPSAGGQSSDTSARPTSSTTESTSS